MQNRSFVYENCHLWVWRSHTEATLSKGALLCQSAPLGSPINRIKKVLKNQKNKIFQLFFKKLLTNKNFVV